MLDLVVELLQVILNPQLLLHLSSLLHSLGALLFLDLQELLDLGNDLRIQMNTLSYQRSIMCRSLSALRIGSSLLVLSIVQLALGLLVVACIRRLIDLRVLLLYGYKVCLSLVRCEGRLREWEEALDLASEVLLLDLIHALLIQLFDLQNCALFLLFCMLSRLLRLTFGLIFFQNDRILVLNRLFLCWLRIEDFPESDILGMKIFLMFLDLLDLGLQAISTENIFGLVHTALRPLFLVLLIFQLRSNGSTTFMLLLMF
jgi:hypothetical protein